jgi:putative PIG3 family NAD(P)H quinone oxidoreductase
MRAVTIVNPGPDYTLALSESETPVPGPGQVLIKVAAAGLNRADVLQAKGKYPPPQGASETLGLEVSGEVAQSAAGSPFRTGDKVVALLAGGGYAEYALADEGSVLPLPAGIDPVEAAGLPEALFTAWTNLIDAAGLKTRQTLLVHGGSSGVGSIAIQLGAALGAKVLTTASGAERCEKCERLGALLAIDHTAEDFVEAVLEATQGHGADVILDMVGGDYIGRNFTAAAPKGRIVNIAYQKGSVATVDFRLMLAKRLTLTATTLRGRSAEEKRAIRDALLNTVWPLIETGAIKPVIDRTFPLAEASAAHAHMAKGGHFGKILLTV